MTLVRGEFRNNIGSFKIPIIIKIKFLVFTKSQEAVYREVYSSQILSAPKDNT